MRRTVALMLVTLATSTIGHAQEPVSDPFGLTALNSVYRLKLGELSLDLQQGGMKSSAPFIHPTVALNGLEIWGTYSTQRADHLSFGIRYGVMSTDPGAPRIRDTDLPNMIFVEYGEQNLDEHLAHQQQLRGVRQGLGAFTACARDTVNANPGEAVLVIVSTAVWRRSGARVVFTTQVTHHDPTRRGAPRPPQLRVAYEVVRHGFPGQTRLVPEPTRTDAGCLIGTDELRALAVPMDSAVFRAIRARRPR